MKKYVLFTIAIFIFPTSLLATGPFRESYQERLQGWNAMHLCGMDANDREMSVFQNLKSKAQFKCAEGETARFGKLTGFQYECASENTIFKAEMSGIFECLSDQALICDFNGPQCPAGYKCQFQWSPGPFQCVPDRS